MENNRTSINSILNRTYFIVPVKINNSDRFHDYLFDNGWSDYTVKNNLHGVSDAFNTDYLLNYAEKILAKDNPKFRAFRYDNINDVKVLDYSNKISYYLKREITNHPEPKEINFYEFSTGIGFFEICITYNEMKMDEITNFIFQFRSFRNDKDSLYNLTDPKESSDSCSLSRLVDKLLPEDKAFVTVCFSNRSRVKKQADIYTVIDLGQTDMCDMSADECRYYLSHGFPNYFEYVPVNEYSDNSSFESRNKIKYELIYNPLSNSFWGGSQDGLTCLSFKPYFYMDNQLANDYHFMYLLLLNIRFSSLNYIDELSSDSINLEDIKSVSKKVISLKTDFSFRVISDDSIYQTIYGRLFEILELDNLMSDITEANERLILMLQENEELERINQNKKEEERSNRFNTILAYLSILTIFSALIDLSDYLDRFQTPLQATTLFSLGIIVTMLIGAYFLTKPKKD